MSHDSGRVCLCQVTHRPHPLELERHHIWPLGMGGPDDDANIAWLCPTAHTNAHEILRHFMRSGALTWTKVGALYDVPVSRYAYDLAVDGYHRWIRATTTTTGATA